mmetsp:Transcript_39506/g.92536  ORF Transcript_39506/g.92536 Transcript_39506/m.92536 type:complete len:80 (-) Transcript_39506:433-672(-)
MEITGTLLSGASREAFTATLIRESRIRKRKLVLLSRDQDQVEAQEEPPISPRQCQTTPHHPAFLLHCRWNARFIQHDFW